MLAAAFLLAILIRLRLAVALTHVHHQTSPAAWDEAVGAFADQIKELTRDMKEKIVVITIAGGKFYVPRWPELLVHYKKRAGLPFAVVAGENRTAAYFQGKGIPCFFFDLRRFGQKPHQVPMHWPNREITMRGKYELTSLLLDRGLTVIMSEADVFWKKNPLVLLDEIPGDFLVTQHQYDRGGEVNVGFYIAKPTPSVRRTFGNVRTWLNSDLRGETPCGGCFDQVLLDYAIRCHDNAKLITKCHFPEVEREVLCDPSTPEADRLNWSYIPWERLPHPPLHHKYGGANDTEMQEYLKVLETAVGTHLWTGFAMPHDKMRYAYDHGFWADDAAPVFDAHPWRDQLAQLREGQDTTLEDAACGCDDLSDW